ncbi:MAG: class I SAM-dependent methyltransferase [Rhodobacteraceae bacterium]|nr:class I SAM-dependent methyltransferase [Paracoccaceae bacterium]
MEGDACDLSRFGDLSFDIAFSNSVIEHVGGPEKRSALAQEARRLAPRYWVQTPSVWFPIEAHTYLPFWWFYPPFLKRAFIKRWRRDLPEWCEMIEGTTVLPFAELRALFPEATILTERLIGLPKSYIATRTVAPHG